MFGWRFRDPWRVNLWELACRASIFQRGNSGQTQSQSAFRRCIFGIEPVFLSVKGPVRVLVGFFVPNQVWSLETFRGRRFF
jgi:hypothetical protein